MFKRLLELIKQALRSMVSYKSVDEVIAHEQTVSAEMAESIDVWQSIYQEKAYWLDDSKGVYSLGLAKDICQQLTTLVLAEAKINTVSPNKGENEENTRAEYIDKLLKEKVLKSLNAELEKAMAVGGMVIKPYVGDNSICFDFVKQGEFYPISFDDNGNITEIAFPEIFIEKGYAYTRIEYHSFNALTNTCIIKNKAYKAKLKEATDKAQQELGIEIPLTMVAKWATYADETTLEGVKKPLYGFYRVPTANNVDLKTPLGMSVFGSAVNQIRKCDEQFSRLDWEFNGGQMAVDVDMTAIRPSTGRYGESYEMDSFKNRLYRKLDLGNEESYNVFAPSLRDAEYINGLDRYLQRVESLVGLSRGSLSDATTEAKTATEIKQTKQQSYVTIDNNQKALGICLEDVIDAVDTLVSLYNLAPEGEIEKVIEWSDSIITDTDTELTQRMTLEQEGIVSKAEVRAWYLGEPLEVAEANIKKIGEERTSRALTDALLDGNGRDEMQEQALEE